MKGIKNFDFFQKLSMDDVTKSTLTGALLSVLAITLMTYLLLMEIADFIYPSIEKDTIVYHDSDQSSTININFGIKFPNMPCHIISVDQADEVGNHRMDIDETLKKTRMSEFTTGLEYTTKFVDVQNVIDAINQKEGCYVSGYIPVMQVAGNFHISHHNYGAIFNYLVSERRDLISKISFNHQFDYLYFGKKHVNRDILARFGMTDFNAFTGAGKLPNYEDGKVLKDFDYFINLIPHLLIDETTSEEYMTYQYSITHKASEHESYDEKKEDEEEFEDDVVEMPIIQVNYGLSPITLKITLARKSLAHTLTHICAIVGGVFVMFSLLNKFLNFLLESGESERKIIQNK